MKLVELLARELDEWSETTYCYTQDADGACYPWLGRPVFCVSEWEPNDTVEVDYHISAKIHSSKTIATDHATAYVTRAMWEAERAKVSTPAWSGAGLPKVGTVCEGTEGLFWRQCEVIGYYHERAVWVRWLDPENFNSYPIEEIEFRPIRTPEQIAAEEREKAINQMRHIAMHDAYSIEPDFGALYDAGYRKQP